jgi:predicted nucleotidyltransferase
MTSPHSSVERIIRRWPTTNSREWLSSFLDRVREDSNVVAVVVVGSAIRSTAPSDDLDLVVICRDRRILREKAPIEIDLRSFDLDRIEGDVRKGQDLLTWSLRYGVPLYDPNGVWADLVHRWKGRLPMPDVSVARSRAETALAQLEAMRAAGDADAVIDLRVSYLTHLARAALAEAGVFPASRPELAGQLRGIGRADLADRLDEALSARRVRRATRTV